MFQQVHSRSDHVDLGPDPQAFLEPLDPLIVGFLDHQRLTHNFKVYLEIYSYLPSLSFFSRKYCTWYFWTFRLWSSSVRANSCDPSFRLTK